MAHDRDALLPVLPAPSATWPMHDASTSRRAEQEAAVGLPLHALMERAGLALARLATAIAPHARQIWIAAGPGNNGGDGLQAAAHLQAAGRKVLVSLLGDPARLPHDAAHALQAARAAGVSIVSEPEPAFEADLAIDALLGLGSSRAPEGVIAQAISRLNRGGPVLAVDLPSGLDAERGALFGASAVHADHTLSLLTLKPGLFTGEGRDHAGRIWFDALGVPAAPADAWLTGRDQAEALDPQRRHAEHKGSFGDVIVVGGAPGMTGAAWLAARAALMAGAGRVYLDVLDRSAGAAPSPELMSRPGIANDHPDALSRSTVVCGCGGGAAVAQALPNVLQHSARLVLDADGLNAVAADGQFRALLARRRSSGRDTLLTPHPLEAARLLGVGTEAVQADRRAAAQHLADQMQCAVLLKGSGSVCAAPGAPAFVNPTGNALLATAGTGDVLAGWAGGRWATMSGAGAAPTAAQHVGAAAAWWHGRAAETAADAGRRSPLVASSLIDAMVNLRR